MKIIAVRNAQIHPQFQPTVHLSFDPATSDLSVSLYLPALATDEAASGDTGLSLIESVVVNVGDGIGGALAVNALVQVATDNTVRIYRNTNCNCNCDCCC